MNQHLSLRKINNSPNSELDYVDRLNHDRRISIDGQKYELHNSIFEDFISIRLNDTQTKVEIHNCEFKKGLSLSWKGNVEPKDYSIFIYKSDINRHLSLVAFDTRKKVSLDFCRVDKLFLSGQSKEVDLYGCQVDNLCLENENCEALKIEKTFIQDYTLNAIKVGTFETDAKELVITNYSRFKTQHGQTARDVSYIYHKLVLSAANSISETRKINYEIAKATSAKYLIVFGYFFNPLYVFFWMVGIIILFSLLYVLLLGETYEKSIYFSIYTFLTIGFGDISDEKHTLIKSVLVFLEGFLGITYCAVFLTSIINSSKK